MLIYFMRYPLQPNHRRYLTQPQPTLLSSTNKTKFCLNKPSLKLSYSNGSRPKYCIIKLRACNTAYVLLDTYLFPWSFHLRPTKMKSLHDLMPFSPFLLTFRDSYTDLKLSLLEKGPSHKRLLLFTSISAAIQYSWHKFQATIRGIAQCFGSHLTRRKALCTSVPALVARRTSTLY